MDSCRTSKSYTHQTGPFFVKDNLDSEDVPEFKILHLKFEQKLILVLNLLLLVVLILCYDEYHGNLQNLEQKVKYRKSSEGFKETGVLLIKRTLTIPIFCTILIVVGQILSAGPQFIDLDRTPQGKISTIHTVFLYLRVLWYYYFNTVILVFQLLLRMFFNPILSIGIIYSTVTSIILPTPSFIIYHADIEAQIEKVEKEKCEDSLYTPIDSSYWHNNIIDAPQIYPVVVGIDSPNIKTSHHVLKKGLQVLSEVYKNIVHSNPEVYGTSPPSFVSGPLEPNPDRFGTNEFGLSSTQAENRVLLINSELNCVNLFQDLSSNIEQIRPYLEDKLRNSIGLKKSISGIVRILKKELGLTGVSLGMRSIVLDLLTQCEHHPDLIVRQLLKGVSRFQAYNLSGAYAVISKLCDINNSMLYLVSTRWIGVLNLAIDQLIRAGVHSERIRPDTHTVLWDFSPIQLYESTSRSGAPFVTNEPPELLSDAYYSLITFFYLECLLVIYSVVLALGVKNILFLFMNAVSHSFMSFAINSENRQFLSLTKNKIFLYDPLVYIRSYLVNLRKYISQSKLNTFRV